MTTARSSISQRLARELAQLDSRQRDAVTTEGALVVRAGPGSGKTRTLVARAAYLLETQISPFRGLACLTFTNPAADEIEHRVRNLGLAAGRRMVCSTVHAFCLREVLRRYAPITGWAAPSPGDVLDDAGQVSLLQHTFDELGISDNPEYRMAAITKIRRSLICQEDLAQFDAREVAAARRYESELATRNLLDFEAMVGRALQIVRDHPSVQDLLHARFPHFVIDEYQDLGGVLHQLVLALREEAKITITAVGDTDQSVYGFTGADPRYLEELTELDAVQTIELEVNYRSGAEIVSASEAALGHTERSRRAADGRPQGIVQITTLGGGLDAHARHATLVAQQRIAEGIAPHRIAVLYPRRGLVLDALLQQFEAAELPFLYERDARLPDGELSTFVQQCASRTLANVSGRRFNGEAPSVAQLARTLDGLRLDSGLAVERSELARLRETYRAVEPGPRMTPSSPAASWLRALQTNLGLTLIAAGHANLRNTTVLTQLENLCRNRDLTLLDLAAGTRPVGKVVLTTYHSSKGREFDTVVLPGLLDGTVPADVPRGGSWVPSSGAALQEQRRLFFVAVSRAETQLHCITGHGFHTRYGTWIAKGPSPFLRALRTTPG